MTLKLTSDDRSAIDLLLGEASAAATFPSTGYVPASDTDHVNAVRRVLQLMAVMPVSEPPADLVSRTLARISAATGQVQAGEVQAGQIQAGQIRAGQITGSSALSSGINRVAGAQQIRPA